MTTIYDFGAGPVPAHQHPNGGGWVADTAAVADAAYIGPRAFVAGGTIDGGFIRGGTIRGGTIYGGTIDGGTILGGTIYGGTILGGAIYRGTIRGGTIWGGAIEGGTIEGGTIRGGTILGGTVWDGTIWDGFLWDGDIVRRTPPFVYRSDELLFQVLNRENGTLRVSAGCMYLTFEEARKHWRAEMGGTPLGDETFRILTFLEAEHTARKGEQTS
jgi:hypothetical protein